MRNAWMPIQSLARSFEVSAVNYHDSGIWVIFALWQAMFWGRQCCGRSLPIFCDEGHHHAPWHVPLNVAVEVPNSCQVKNTKGCINQLETGVRICGVIKWLLPWGGNKGTRVLFGLIFLFSTLLLIRFTPSNLCCISNTLMKHHWKPDWKLDVPWFSRGYQNCMFVGLLSELHGFSQSGSLLSVE